MVSQAALCGAMVKERTAEGNGARTSSARPRDLAFGTERAACAGVPRKKGNRDKDDRKARSREREPDTDHVAHQTDCQTAARAQPHHGHVEETHDATADRRRAG